MKKYLYLSAAALAFAGCSSDEFLGEVTQPQEEILKQEAIAFGSQKTNITRADHTGAAAATLLNNNFVVEGVMGDGTSQTEAFDHYNVNYKASTANTTESNTADWEYVGQTKHTLSAASAQTIKYWNYDTKQYDFVAFSYGKAAKTNVATDGPVLSEIDYSKLGAAISTGTPVYTVTGSAADLAKTYVADLVTLYNRDGVSEYGTTVTPKFRSLGTKVRIAFYETVPGYSVTNLKFYSTAWDGTSTYTETSDATPTLFASSAIFPSTTSKGTMSVYFPTVGWANSAHGTLSADYNQAHIKFAAGSESGDALVKTKTFDALDYQAAPEGSESSSVKYLGRTSATATYAGDKTTANNNAYEIVLPLGTKDNLQLRVEYDLVPTDGGAGTIHVRDACAVVPAKYADWKPNYAYTYIFKISDNTNGWTGTQPVLPNPEYDPTDPDSPEFIEEPVEGLTPITFDAVVVDTEDGIQETITTVATPSITTYQEGKVVTGKDEYTTGDIYVSVMKGTSAFTLSDNPKNYGVLLVTEGAGIVTEALAEGMLSGKLSNTGVTWTTNSSEVVAKVPMADGNQMDQNAVKFTGYSGHTYVFYAVVDGKNHCKVIKVQ